MYSLSLSTFICSHESRTLLQFSAQPLPPDGKSSETKAGSRSEQGCKERYCVELRASLSRFGNVVLDQNNSSEHRQSVKTSAINMVEADLLVLGD
jgi:hypothetical protein